MSVQFDSRKTSFLRLAIDNDDDAGAGDDRTDAMLAARIAHAVQAMERLVAALEDSGSATEASRLAVEFALTRIDEQLMLATRAHFTATPVREAASPGRSR